MILTTLETPRSRKSVAEEMELDRKMSDKGFSELDLNELDEWLFRQKQMHIYTRLGIIWGFIQIVIGSICTFVLRIPQVKTFFNVHCIHRGDVWEPHSFFGELFVTGHMLITMLYITLYYIIFWTIPFQCNQVDKTPREVFTPNTILNPYSWKSTVRSRRRNDRSWLPPWIRPPPRILRLKALLIIHSSPS